MNKKVAGIIATRARKKALNKARVKALFEGTCPVCSSVLFGERKKARRQEVL